MMEVKLIDQHQTNAAAKYAYRVELLDASGRYEGVGYGHTPEQAYANAKQDFIDDADRKFAEQVAGGVLEPEE